MLPLKDDEKRRWIAEIDQAEAFRDKEFGVYRRGGKTTERAGINLDYFEYGANVQQDGSRAPVNLAFILAKNIVPLLFPNNPRVLSFPTRKQDAASAPVSASILNHYLRLLNVKQMDQQVVFDTWLLGYCVSKAGYLAQAGADVGRTEAETRQRLRDRLKAQADTMLTAMGLKKPAEPEPPPMITEDGFLRAENPYLRWVDPFDFLIDPRARSIHDAQWVGESCRRTLRSVKATTRYHADRLKLKASPVEGVDVPETQLDQFETVQLYELHYKHPDAPNGITILILGQASGQWVTLYHEHSIYERMRGWQYDLLAFNKHQHKLYPIADLSHVRPLLDQFNNTFVSVLEQVNKFVSKVVFNTDQVSAEGQLALKNSEIGSLVKATGDLDNAVRIVNMDQVKQDLVVLIEKILDLIVLVTGLTRAQLTGLTTAQTATEAQIGQGGTVNRRSDQVDAVMEFVTDQVEKLWSVITEFVELEDVQLLAGEPMYEDETGLPKYSFLPEIAPEHAEALRHGEYRFQIEVTSMQRPNLEILRKQVENMAVVLTNEAIHIQLAQQGKMFDVAEGLRVWLRLYPELIADVNRLIRPVSRQVLEGAAAAPTNGPGGDRGGAAEAVRQAPPANTADIASAAAGERGQGMPLA